MKPAPGPQVASSMQSIPLRLLVIRPVTNPSIPWRAPSIISTPTSAGPTMGAYYRGKVTEDVHRVILIMGPFLRGEFEESRHRHMTRQFTQVRPRRCGKYLLLLY